MLSQTWAALHLHWRALMAARSAEERETVQAKRGLTRVLRCERPWMRRLVHGGLAMTGLAMIACGLLWWRLASGPLTLDMVTPWLTSAIEQRFGGNHHVEVGGTQLERDDDGRTALRLRDVVVRGPNGAVVASAPKAEVGISGANLFLGQLQAVRLSLIGATMALRVETNGQVSVSAGTEKSPVVTPFVVGTMPTSRMALASSDQAPGSQGEAPPVGQDIFAALLNWLDGLNALGLDGRDLTEIGLKNGSVVVDDKRSGKHWSFDNINLSLTRPKEGGVAFTLTSNGADGPWSLTATVTPHEDGRRAIEAVVRDISPKDIMLALRANGALEADMPLSAIVRAEIGPDGAMLMGEGRILAGAGFIGDGDDPKNRLLIDEAQLQWRWDPTNHVLIMPLEVQSGGNQIKLIAQLEAPHEAGGAWAFDINRGMIVLGAADRSRETPLVLDRVLVHGRIDPTKRRIDLDQGELGGLTAGLAFSGGLDYSGADPRLTFGIAANRMSVAAFKRLWPVFIVPETRNWVIDHVQTGTVDRVVIATNATIPEIKPGGPPMPDGGASVEITANATFRPVDTLPAIRDADISVRTTGRTAKVTIGRGTIDLPSGKKLFVSNGAFDILDTTVKPAPARVRMRIDGAVDAAAELMGMEPLSSAAALPVDPATLRGAFAAQISVAWPIMSDLPKGALTYQVDADVTNFSADKLVRGLKADAAILKFTANPQGMQVKGDVKIGNAMVTADYRKPRGDGDPEVRAQTTLDDAARARMGFDLGGTLTGPVPMKISGRIGGGGDRDNRFAIDADLTQSKVVDLLPGWNKPAGKPSRATFVLIEKPTSRRFEDLVLEGAGALVKGTVEIDADGDVAAVNFPTFALSDGDKASLKADRGSDGTLRVTIRGDVYDGRGFVKALMSGPSDQKPRKSAYDFDLDVKLGTVAGFHGETLRGLDLRLSRRAGQIRSLAFNSKLGRDAPFTADLQGRNGRQVVVLNTEDAGALFRFIDLYPRMEGGTMVVEIDPPTIDHAPQNGIVAIRSFTVRDPALNRIAASAPANEGFGRNYMSQGQGVEFSRMRIDFTRAPGRLTIRDSVVSGPAVGATFEGNIDFQHDDVRLRGTFVPAYALNNLAAQVVPIIGPIISGGKNEGLFGITFEVTGTPGAMTLRPNPISPLAPGFLRKIFEFRRLEDESVGGAAAR